MHTPDHASVLFLTWAVHRRTRELSSSLGLPLVELISTRSGFRRYVELVARTWRTLRERRPAVLIVQSPSLVLSLVAVLWRPFFHYKLVIDAHNEAVEPYLHPSPLVRAVTYWLLRTADRVVVTNEPLADLVARRGGRPIVLPDRLPSPPTGLRQLEMQGGFHVAVIATFAEDEPIAAIFEAAALVGSSYEFHVTGNDRKLSAELRSAAPPNVTFTGFLDDLGYWSLLKSCDVVMDLTLMDDCLVCGAYEAVSLDKPLLLSGNRASRDLFAGLAEFVDNSARDIARGLTTLRDRLPEMEAARARNRRALEARWARHAKVLTDYIHSCLRTGG